MYRLTLLQYKYIQNNNLTFIKIILTQKKIIIHFAVLYFEVQVQGLHLQSLISKTANVWLVRACARCLHTKMNTPQTNELNMSSLF